MKNIYFSFIVVFLLSSYGFSQPKLDKNTFGDIQFRNIGPAVMSGRISAVDALISDPRVIYVATAGGGIYKSENGGTTFKQVFDKEIQAVGEVSIDQNHPDTVWAGTGEPWTRNSTSVGNGIYLSTDGGKTWKNKGLDKTERFSYIKIDPKNSNVVYAGALGPLWDASEERGLFKTTDFGETWQKILYVDENSGCSSIAIDPENPQRIYAGFWDLRRKPWYFRSGGKGSGFYISNDGGQNWDKITKGLPTGIWGRVHVEVSPVDNNIIYLLVEAEKTSFYRSKDKGASWELMNNNANDVGERPFYFGFFVPDPVDTNKVYKPGFALQVSKDGGKSYMSPSIEGGNFHSDVHDLWISPNDNNLMYLATDGGLYVSRDAANTWSFFRNIPVAQFYHVSVDNEKPYNIFGGLQDNGSWIAPSKSAGGITNNDWKRVGWGDGFNVLRDPKDDNIMYWQWQGGGTRRAYLDTRELKDIKPYSNDGTLLRFNWNTPLVFGVKSNKLYMGSQFLFVSSDKGNSWEKISPDLTTNDPEKLRQEETGGLTLDNSAAENHCTIITLGESPLDEKIIWVGTDDGNVQLTKDGGKTWENVRQYIPDVPAFTWVSYVEPSNYKKGTAYVTFDGHKIGDRSAWVFKTEDFGKTWQNIGDENLDAYCHIIKEDLYKPDLLFLGTEYGLFLSIDGGDNWTRFTGNLPKVSVRDMVFQKRENDLVVATHGRGIYILDDLSPLQDLSVDKLSENIAFLNSRPYKLGFNYGMGGSTGDDGFRGSNPSETMMITYYMKKRHIFGDMSLEVFNSEGEKIKTLPAGKRKGINIVKWQMRMEEPKVPSSVQLLGNAMVGPEYPPGEYMVKIVKNKDTITGIVKVEYYENPHHSIADRDQRHEILMKAYNMLESLAYLDNQILEIRDQAKLKADSVSGSLAKRLKALSSEMEDTRSKILATKEGRITGEERIRERLGEIYGGVMSYDGRPTESQIEGLEKLAGQIEEINNALSNTIMEQLPKFNNKLLKLGVKPFNITSREAFMEEK